MPGIALSISCTTRQQRKGEVDGKDYHFIDRDTFARMRDQGEFLEWAVVFDNYLWHAARARSSVALADGRDVLFDVDWQGAESLRDETQPATSSQCSFCRRRQRRSSSA